MYKKHKIWETQLNNINNNFNITFVSNPVTINVDKDHQEPLRQKAMHAVCNIMHDG